MFVASQLDIDRWTEETPPSPLVKKADLQNLRGLEETFDAFFPNFVGLRDLDLSYVCTLRSIGKSFLFRCCLLTHVDLAPLRHVTSIGSNFLYGCSALEDVDLQPLRRIKSIPAGFLQGCTGLTTLNLKPLTGVTSIGSHFLYGCGSLGPSLDLTMFKDVVSIGAYFLGSCVSITSLDISGLLSCPCLIHPVGDHFLERCSGIVTLAMPPKLALNAPTSIGCSFLQGCTRLASISLDAFHSVESIGGHFLHGCCSLQAICLTPLGESLRTAGSCFLYGCTGLRVLDLTPLQRLKVIGAYFLVGSSPTIIFTDDRPMLLEALKASALADRCCVSGLPYVTTMREKLADCEHRLEVLAGLELEVEAGIEVKNSYNTLQRKHAVLEAVHDKAIAENEELREQLAAALHRAESAENRCAELQEAKARTLAKYTKIRDSNINERLHEATNRLTALSAEHDRVSDLLADARKELTANEEVNSQYVGEYGSVKNMARELEQSKQALAKAKTIQSEGLKKLQELHTRLKTEIDSKNQLQASFQKLNQELLQLKMAKSAAAS